MTFSTPITPLRAGQINIQVIVLAGSGPSGSRRPALRGLPALHSPLFVPTVHVAAPRGLLALPRAPCPSRAPRPFTGSLPFAGSCPLPFTGSPALYGLPVFAGSCPLPFAGSPALYGLPALRELLPFALRGLPGPLRAPCPSRAPALCPSRAPH